MRKTPAPLLAETSPAKTITPKPSPKMPAAKMPAAKAIPVKKAAAAPPAVAKSIAETPATYFTGAAGRAWRMSGKHAVAYVHTAALASELLATEPRQVAGTAMAVYYDRKGRPFAWQFRFDTARWAEVTGRLV